MSEVPLYGWPTGACKGFYTRGIFTNPLYRSMCGSGLELDRFELSWGVRVLGLGVCPVGRFQTGQMHGDGGVYTFVPFL